jgi:hypothetical protein
LQDLTGGTLRWAHPPLPPRTERKFIYVQKPIFELTRAGEIFATLEWIKGRGSPALGQTAEATFTFKRGRILRAYATVCTPGSESNLAEIRLGLGGGGTLSFQDGRQYGFNRRGLLNPEWTFTDGSGRSLCRFSLRSRLVKLEGEVVLDVDPRSFPDHALLVLLGWYVIVQQHAEAQSSPPPTV